MKQLSLRALALLIAILTTGTGLALLLLDPLPLQTLRNQLFDQYQRWHPRNYTPAPVRIIDIDDESLEKLGQWPWPRTRVGEMVQRLRDQGAAAIGFDVVFAEEDRTSPKAMVTLWPLEPGVKASLQRLPDHDAVMADVLRKGDVVVGFSVERTQGPAVEGARLPAAPFRYVWSGEPATAYLHPFTSAILTLPGLESAAAGNGALTFVPDFDGVVRRVPLVLRLADKPVPTLASETLRVGQGAKNYILKSAEAQGTGLQEIRIGELTIPTTPNGEMWVHYSRAEPARYIPAWKVLAGQVPADQIKGHLLLVGSSAQGLMDLRFNPLGRIMPGVEAHAQALEQVLTQHYLERPGWARTIEAILIVIGTLVVTTLAMTTRALISAAAALLLIGGVLWGGWWAFVSHGLLINGLTPAAVILAGYILASLAHHFWSENQQRWVKEAFSHYVSPNLVDHLVSNPGLLELGGKRQQCSFIFTDLAGFTSLMEKIDPAQAVALLNAYLDEMIAIAFRHGGTLDRIVGDAVAIVFSAPVEQPDHQQRALTCAREMYAFATRYAEEHQAQGVAFGYTRLGIHSGEVIVGNFGGSTIFDYRALGDPVNTAARLESVNKHLGTRICVSEATLSGCPADTNRVRPVGQLVLKGKTRAIKVYEPLPDAMPEAYAPTEAYTAAYALMESGEAGGAEAATRNEAALAAFSALSASHPKDPLVQLHLKRLQGGAVDDRIVMDEK